MCAGMADLKSLKTRWNAFPWRSRRTNGTRASSSIFRWRGFRHPRLRPEMRQGERRTGHSGICRIGAGCRLRRASGVVDDWLEPERASRILGDWADIFRLLAWRRGARLDHPGSAWACIRRGHLRQLVRSGSVPFSAGANCGPAFVALLALAAVLSGLIGQFSATYLHREPGF